MVRFFLLVTCQSETNSSTQQTSQSQTTDKAIAEWESQKYSMFIHFGVYSELGGVWNNERVEIGYSEQIRAHGDIPRDDFREVASTFNPVNWNPDSVAVLAKNAGMKLIVVTAKHQDRFSLYDTKYSDSSDLPIVLPTLIISFKLLKESFSRKNLI